MVELGVAGRRRRGRRGRWVGWPVGGSSLAGRAVVLVLLALAALVAGAVAVRTVVSPARAVAAGPASSAAVSAALRDAVARTVAERSARIDATYVPAAGPAVAIHGRVSLVGPESEVSASVGDGPPAAVRVAADGAWLRPPGAEEWTAISPAEVTAAGVARGWADVLGDLHASDEVVTDAQGRIVRIQVRRDRAGGRLDVRLSDFGTAVPANPP